jgi:thioesterase domain-containing protein
MFEVARCLSQRGREIGLLALLDTELPRYFWPLRAWLRFLLGRVRHHALCLTELPPSDVIPWLRHRAAAFSNHIASRRYASGLSRGPAEPAFLRLHQRLTFAEKRYRLRPYSGKLTIFLSAELREVGCMAVWGPLAKEIEIISVPGDHLSMLFSEPLGAQISYCVERALKTGG